MLGTGWMVRTARECGKLPEGLAAIKRASQENSSFSLTQIRNQKKRQALADRMLWVLELNQHTQVSLTTKSQGRDFTEASLSEEKRGWKPLAKTTAISVSNKCAQQARPPSAQPWWQAQRPWGQVSSPPPSQLVFLKHYYESYSIMPSTFLSILFRHLGWPTMAGKCQ